MRKVGVYADEVAQLIGATLTQPRDADVAVQTVCLLLLLLHTAGRASTYMPSKHTNFYMTVWSRAIMMYHRRSMHIKVFYEQCIYRLY